MTFGVIDLPKLLPVHHFSTLGNGEIFDRMACEFEGDETSCGRWEEVKCQALGSATLEYDSCHLKLLEKTGRNATQFCESHYGKNAGPGIYEPEHKHECLRMAGVPFGREYCVDMKN